MDALYQKNLQIFQKILPGASREIAAADCTGLQFCETRQGEQNLKEERNGKTHYWHSNYSAKKEAEKWFSSLDLSNNVSVIYCYGVGLGHYYHAAKEWLYAERDRHLVFIEDDPRVIKRLLECKTGQEILLDQKVQLHYLKDMEAARVMFGWLSWYFILLHLEVGALDYYSREKSERFMEVRLKLVHDCAQNSSLAGEYMRYGTTFFNNFYRNILKIAKSSHGNKLFGKFKGVPAIICGAGPSLKLNGHLLPELKEKALILGGGSSVNALLGQGVTPHMAAGIDPNPYQQSVISKNTLHDIPFFYRSRIFCEALSEVRGPRLYINGTGGYQVSEWFEKQLGVEDVVIEEGHNVINFLLDIATHLGCNPIIFVGMDLAYTGMKSYAPGVVRKVKVEEKEIVKSAHLSSGAFLRSDIYGNDVYTLWKWIAESEWIGNFAKTHPRLKVLNCTEGGLGIPGVENMPLEEAAKRYLNVQHPLTQRVHTELQNASFGSEADKILKESFDELRGSLRNSKRICQEMLKEIENIEKKVKTKPNFLTKRLQSPKAERLEKELVKEPAYRYVLEGINTVRAKALERQHAQVQNKQVELSFRQRQLQSLEINQSRFFCLKQAAEANLKILKNISQERPQVVVEQEEEQKV